MKILAGLIIAVGSVGMWLGLMIAIASLTGCAHLVHAKSAPLASLEASLDATYLESVKNVMPVYIAGKNAAYEQPEINAVLDDLEVIDSPGGNLHEQIQKLLEDNRQLTCLDKHLTTHQVL